MFKGRNRISDWYVLRNGHDRKTLQKIINNFEKKTRSISNNNNNPDKKRTIIFPWIPKFGPKIKKEILKIGFRAGFQTGP